MIPPLPNGIPNAEPSPLHRSKARRESAGLQLVEKVRSDFFDKLPAKSQNKKLHFILRFWSLRRMIEREREPWRFPFTLSFPPIFVTKHVFASLTPGAPAPGVRLSKKPVIAIQCAPRSKCPWGTHWRGNPFLKRINSAFFADFCLKRYGFPRRFAPRNDRGEVYRHAKARRLGRLA